MTKAKSISEMIMGVIAFGLGCTFPWVPMLWKIVILMLFVAFRVNDIEKDKKWFGATSWFFIGMIISYIFYFFLTP